MQYLSPQVCSAPRSNEALQRYAFAQEPVCLLRDFHVAPRTPLYLPKASPRGASRFCIANRQCYSDSVQTTRQVEGPAFLRYFSRPSHYMNVSFEDSSSAEISALCRRSLFHSVGVLGTWLRTRACTIRLRLFLIAFFSINLRLLSPLFPPSVSSCFLRWSLVSIGGIRNSLYYVLHEESLGQVVVIVLILVRRLVETGRSILASAEFSHGMHARHRIITCVTSGAPGDSILALTLVMTFQSHLRRPLSSCQHSLLRRKLALFLILR